MVYSSNESQCPSGCLYKSTIVRLSFPHQLNTRFLPGVPPFPPLVLPPMLPPALPLMTLVSVSLQAPKLQLSAPWPSISGPPEPPGSSLPYPYPYPYPTHSPFSSTSDNMNTSIHTSSMSRTVHGTLGRTHHVPRIPSAWVSPPHDDFSLPCHDHFPMTTIFADIRNLFTTIILKTYTQSSSLTSILPSSWWLWPASWPLSSLPRILLWVAGWWIWRRSFRWPA